MTKGNETKRGFLQASGTVVAGLLANGRGSATSRETTQDAPTRVAFDVREFGANGDGKEMKIHLWRNTNGWQKSFSRHQMPLAPGRGSRAKLGCATWS
jgi:hypothetical protein